MKSFTFNGVRKSWLVLLNGRTKPPFASINRQLLTIPGRHGAFLQSSQKEPIVINQPIAFLTDGDMDALTLKDELAEWLVTDEPVELQFDDEPGRTYYAVVQNTLEDFESIATYRQGTIQFLVLDGLGYSDETSQNITAHPNIANEGTAETFPIFEVDVKEPITFLEIQNKSIVDRQGNNPSIMLGTPATIEEEKYQKEELVFHDSMQSTQTWQTASEVDNGYIAGEIAVSNKGFYPRLFGPGIEPGAWQGPSLQKGIGTALQDFRADILIENMNTDAEMGMMAIYLRDANNNIVARIGFGDTWMAHAQNFGHAQLGNYHTGPRVDAYAADRNGWNNFNGILRVERIDNEWKFYYARIEKDGTHNWIHSTSRIVDSEFDYIAPITTVQVAFRVWYGAKKTDMHIKDIKIYKINKPASTVEDVVLEDNMNSLVPWKQATKVDNGHIAGSIDVDSKGSYPRSFGANIQNNYFQGPSLIRSIGYPLYDFRAEIRIESMNYTGDMGMIAVYFRDAFGNKIANIGFGDTWVSKSENFGHAQLGDYETGPRVDAYAEHQNGWNNFDGLMRIERKDNVWNIYFARIESDGSHNWIWSRGIIVDEKREFMAPITDVQVAFRKWVPTKEIDMRIKQIKITRITQESTATVPYLAMKGDKLTINTKTSQVRKNGEIANELLDLKSQMFPLAKGVNRLDVSPKDAVEIKARYRKAYL